jgi:hypothetical protein
MKDIFMFIIPSSNHAYEEVKKNRRMFTTCTADVPSYL